MKFLNKIILFTGISLCTNAVQAKTVSTPSAALIINEELGQRVCYFEDKAYTIGAVIQVSDILLECVAEKSFETNGALTWVKLDVKNEQ
ncbi:DUF1496 domain-containing protein [Vibrio genomosp. F6]|uniref:DUF1496 domain-containing protein n=1 Tax=Vibrio genomosp. F6 str. FF-238 TaxID=1191298 RepID=A0A1E5D6M6_9VIBR|nr:DUF1496 domain-containing protein [Vibrio genomosp. F6]OEE79271.1 hypothetical protein A130_12135 [Vibrio genomosp. F6 str. FF-238]